MMELGFSVEKGRFFCFLQAEKHYYIFFFFFICYSIESSLPGTGSDAMQLCEFRDI